MLRVMLRRVSPRTIRVLVAALAMVTVMCLLSPSAMAQAAPQPSITRTPAPWLGFLIVAALGVALIFINLMPSKRGHQD